MKNAAIAQEYQTVNLAQLTESTTNPRRTFEESKLHELAESIRVHGLIQPITVRPRAEGFEIVAGARRFRAARIAEQSTVPVRILKLSDDQALELQIIENTQRQDVHPYEEAAGYQRLLDLPGYDVPGLAAKCGKSQSHVYARLALLQLVPEVAEAFQQEKITASHANLIARLTPEQQAEAYKRCWKDGWPHNEPILLPTRHLAAWIQDNLYLPLAEAPFSKEDPALNPEAGACVTCPRRSGFNAQLFGDVEGDQCFDAKCYQSKVSASIERELAANPELVQITTSYRPQQERTDGQLEPNQFTILKPKPQAKREINPDAEDPSEEESEKIVEGIGTCPHVRTGLVVYGKNIGNQMLVCTDPDCPIHNARRVAVNPDWEKQQEERRKEQERRDRARASREKRYKALTLRFPSTLNPEQMRFLLNALALGDTDLSRDRLAMAHEDEQDTNTSAEDVCARIIANAEVDAISGIFAQLALGSHVGLPNPEQHDFLAVAERVFPDPEAEKKKIPKADKKPDKKQVAKSAAKGRKTGTTKPATAKRSKA